MRINYGCHDLAKIRDRGGVLKLSDLKVRYNPMPASTEFSDLGSRPFSGIHGM